MQHSPHLLGRAYLLFPVELHIADSDPHGGLLIRVSSIIFQASGRRAGTFLPVVLLAALFAGSASRPTRAQDKELVLPRVAQDQIDLLATRVAQQIRNSKTDPAFPKLLVIDFSNASDKQFSSLGTLLADNLSGSLSAREDGFAVQDRGSLRAYMEENWMELPDLQSKDVCLALARSLGAAGVLLGDVQEDPDHQLLLTIRVEGFGPAWSAGALFPLTDQMQTLLKKPTPSVARAPSAIPLEPDVFRAGVDGVGVPVCIRCMPPNYSNLARAAKYQGTVMLSLVVAPDGHANSIVVLKGAPFDLTKQAIDAVQEWQFKPAEKDGKPVATRVTVETTFRLK